MLDCPTPTQGPVPCPSTVEQHLTNIRKILPRGIAWISVFDPTSVMYRYWLSIATTYQWANDQFCLALREMFCATRVWLDPDYDVEFGLPNPCNPNLDPCSILPVESAKCLDLVDYAAAAGWALQCLRTYTSAAGCSACGCSSSGAGISPATQPIQVSTGSSPVYTPGQSASSGVAASGITVSGCSNSGPGTIPALHCLIDSFLPAHISYTLQVVS